MSDAITKWENPAYEIDTQSMSDEQCNQLANNIDNHIQGLLRRAAVGAYHAGKVLYDIRKRNRGTFYAYAAQHITIGKTTIGTYIKVYEAYKDKSDEDRQELSTITIERAAAKAPSRYAPRKIPEPGISPAPKPTKPVPREPLPTELEEESPIVTAIEIGVIIGKLTTIKSEIEQHPSVPQSLIDLVGEIYELCESKIDKVISVQ